RAVKFDVERNQPRQRGVLADGAPRVESRLQRRAAADLGLGPRGGEPGRQRVDRATHLIELADTRRIERGDLKAAAAALGHQALPVQQMQRVGNRLARHAELLGEFVLGDALPRRQRAVDDRLEDSRIDLVDQVGERIQRDHVDRPIWNTEFRIRNMYLWRWRRSRVAVSPMPDIIVRGDKCGVVVSFPDVPEAITQGDDMTDARAQAEEALGLALLTYPERGLPLPK